MADELATVSIYKDGAVQRSLGPVTLQGSAALLPLSDPTFTANTNPLGGNRSGNSVALRAISGDTGCMRLAPSGHLLTGAFYLEDRFAPQIFTSSGVPSGQTLENTYWVNGVDGMGIDAIAVDGSGIVYAGGYSNGVIHILSNPALSGAAFTIAGLTGDDGNAATKPTAYTPGLTLNAPGTGWITGMVLIGTNLYVAWPSAAGFEDGASGQRSPAAAKIAVVPLSNKNSITTSWTVPNVRTLCKDASGRIWALQQASTFSARAGVLSCWTTAGSLVGSYLLPLGVYPMDIACDPNSSTILVCDNSQDQNIKKYDFTNIATAGTNAAPVATTNGPNPGVATVGVQFGYLNATTAAKGTLGANRLIGPRCVDIDSSSNVYIAQTAAPGIGDAGWHYTAPLVNITKQDSSGNELWRHYSCPLSEAGTPSADGLNFYTRFGMFTRTNSGVYDGAGGGVSMVGVNSQYKLTACTVDPWTYAQEDRFTYGGGTDAFGCSVRVFDANGSRYLVMQGDQGGIGWIYQMVGNIARECVTFSGTTLTLDGVNHTIPDITNFVDFWVDDSQNVWIIRNDGTVVYRFRVQGYSGGTPQYSAAAMDTYSAPSNIANMRRLEVHGTSVYISGYASGDADTSPLWKSAGRLLSKFTSLPSPSFPTAAWTYTMYAGAQTDPGPYPVCFSVDPSVPKIAIAYLESQTAGALQAGGGLAFLNDNGTLSSSLPNPAPSYGLVGRFDMMRAIGAVNGYVWCEEDWSYKVYGVALAGR